MLKRISHLWWLILAWLLAMFGENFWQFNVMELFASIAIIVGAYFAIRGWCRERRRKQERKEIRITLGKFLEEGKQIKSKCYDKSIQAPVKDGENWADKVTDYLRKNLGNDNADTFNSSEGLILSQYSNLNGDKYSVDRHMEFRLARLNQFLAELRQSD